jgi:ribosomal protein L40E
VAAEHGTLGNRAYLETVITALGQRLFLLHDVHRGQPVLFQSRHALSFLRGPLTREQVALLMEPLKGRPTAAPAGPAAPGGKVEEAVPTAIPLCRRCGAELAPGAAECGHCGEPVVVQPRSEERAARPAPAPAPGAPPALPAEVVRVYLPLASPARPAGADLVYQPRVLGVAEVAFLDKKRGQSHRQTYRLLAPPPTAGQPAAWHAAEKLATLTAGGAETPARWDEVPESLNTARKLKALEKSLAVFLYDHARLTLRKNEELDLISEPREDEMAFRARCRAAARQEADRAVAAERLKYLPKFETLGARLPGSPAETANHDTSLLEAFNPLRWVELVARHNRPPAPRGDKVARLETEWLNKQAALYEKWQKAGEEVADVPLAPRRQDVQVTQVALAWAPFWQLPAAVGKPEMVPAYR